MSEKLIDLFTKQLKKSLKHLNYSFLKVQKLPVFHEDSPEEELEVWESFSSRFARSSDLFISKYLRQLMLTKDPAFRGSVIDILNEAEKFGWIESSSRWRRIRQLRNVAAHEYATDDLQALYQELIKLCPDILRIENIL